MMRKMTTTMMMIMMMMRRMMTTTIMMIMRRLRTSMVVFIMVMMQNRVRRWMKRKSRFGNFHLFRRRGNISAIKWSARKQSSISASKRFVYLYLYWVCCVCCYFYFLILKMCCALNKYIIWICIIFFGAGVPCAHGAVFDHSLHRGVQGEESARPEFSEHECVLVYGFLCVLRGRRQVADHHVLQRAHVRPQPRRRNHRPHKMGGISSCSFNSPGRGRGNQSQHREGFVKGVTEANGAR